MARCRLVHFIAALFSSAILVRADLVLEQTATDTNHVNHVMVRLHDGKMRMDEWDDAGHGYSAIVDLNTRASLTLLPKTKEFIKRSGEEARKQVEMEIAAAAAKTNQMNDAPAPPIDTGRKDKVNDYDTEIYKWSGADGLIETLWVATNFPDYTAIRTNLALIDRFNAAGSHKNAQPAASLLPGMIVKIQREVNGRTATNTLVSAMNIPLNPSLFELPVNYSSWQPPKAMTTNAPITAAPGNPR